MLTENTILITNSLGHYVRGRGNMCYAKPGPRCSYHAKKSLKKAISLEKTAQTPEEAKMFKNDVRRERHKFYETKEGLAHLEKIMGMGKESEIYQLFSDVRKKKLEAYHDKFSIKNKKDIFGSKAYKNHNQKVEEQLKKHGLWDKAQEQQKMLETAILEKRSLTTEELESHKNYVARTLKTLSDENISTEHMFARNTSSGPRWDSKRAKLQDEIINDYVDRHENIPCEGKLFVAGGMGGAGKSSTIMKHNVVDVKSYAVVNPDDLKEEMAKRNMIPHVPGTMSMEVNTLVHEEASSMSKKIMTRMLAKRKNVILDITMAGLSSTESKIKKFKDQGYEIKAMFVDIDTETSKERGMSRYLTGTQETIIKGEGYGGRFLPTKLVDNQKSQRTGVSSINAENIHALNRNGMFDSDPQIFDNRGAQPIRVSSKDFFDNIERS